MTLIIVTTVGIYLSLRDKLPEMSDPSFFRTVVLGYAVLGAALAVAGIIGSYWAAG